MNTWETILNVAQDLASVEGENPEYDRALVEMVANLMPGEYDANRAWAEAQIVKG